jgi:hypothetical protein
VKILYPTQNALLSRINCIEAETQGKDEFLMPSSLRQSPGFRYTLPR